jgi:cellobiose-specific phosphotransferase system component IIC
MDSHATVYRYNLLSRGILGGLFVGIIAAAVNMAFDYIYRKATHYQFSEFVNINSIIFFTIPTLVAAGIVYALVRQYVKRGMLVYTILALALTVIVALFIPLGPNMLPNGETMPSDARGLTMGIEIITGLFGAFGLPYFAEHPKIWSDAGTEQYR